MLVMVQLQPTALSKKHESIEAILDITCLILGQSSTSSLTRDNQGTREEFFSGIGLLDGTTHKDPSLLRCNWLGEQGVFVCSYEASIQFVYYD